MWLRWLVVAVSCAFACGDNTVPVAPPLQHSDTLFLGAHEDDDMIFMEPELLRALHEGSTTTVYATTAGPDGIDRHLFEAAMVAYGKIAGSSAWDCGQLALGDVVVDHCRSRDKPVSLVNLGISDGGIPGDRLDSLLHLFDGTVAELPVYDGGTVTSASVTDLFVRLFEATTPDRLETLELAGSHGRDHSSHMFVASIGLWAAARVGYTGPATWHRGYNVDTEAPSLDGDALGDSRTLLGYYEACADHCGACGKPCPTVTPSHETWLARQYASTRVLAASGALALDDTCLTDTLELGDCASAARVELDPTGALRIGDRCLASTADDGLELAACTGAPEQYWVLDSEGSLWNGRIPEISADMTFDHVRCLAGTRATTCGAHLQARWRVLP